MKNKANHNNVASYECMMKQIAYLKADICFHDPTKNYLKQVRSNVIKMWAHEWYKY